MSKFKINDEVLTEYGEGVVVYNKDDVLFLVKIEGFDGHNGNGIETKQDNNNNWWFYEDGLELVEKLFTLDDLEVGFVIEMNGIKCLLVTKESDNYPKGTLYAYKPKGQAGQQLHDYGDTLEEIGITKVWGLSSEYQEVLTTDTEHRELLWEEKERLYTLELPNTASCYRYYSKDDYAYLFDDIHDDNGYQHKFTQKEIDELKQGDHGGLIKMLKQEPVK